jgi:predicted N-formylglutamate amidohydrolase
LETPHETIEPRSAGAPYFFSCEHAGREVPPGHDEDGFGPEWLDSHHGWDPGAADLARGLARRFEGGGILARWTRLLIDLNRSPADAELIRRSIAGRALPANRDLTPREKNRRLDRYHTPFHRAFHRELSRARQSCPEVVLVSVHSFTPRLAGRRRPMEFGLLFNGYQERVADVGRLLLRAGRSVAYNAPYSGRDGKMYSAGLHGHRLRIPHFEIEVRNDLLLDDRAAIEMLLAGILADSGLVRK